MPTDNPNLLQVLKSELQFLENGGYRQTARAAWRPQFMFQDSPTCLNFDPTQPPRPCSDCVLLQLVPEDMRAEKIPCRHIVLNVEGYTIDTYYRLGTQEELEAAVAEWLRKTIQQLEGNLAQRQGESCPPKRSDSVAVVGR